MSKKAFTLVEMAIVLVIIGILSAMVFSNIGGFGKKARDQKRASDLQKAYAILTAYFNANGTLPSPGNNKKFREVTELRDIKPPLSGEDYYYNNTTTAVNKGYLAACFESGIGGNTIANNLANYLGAATSCDDSFSCPGGSECQAYEISF